MRIAALTVVVWLAAAPALAGWTQLSGPRPPAAAAFVEHEGACFLGTNEADAGDIFVSDDGGRTWANAGLPNGGVIEFLSTPGAIFAGTYLGGLWRSDDGGATWARVGAQVGTLSTVSALAQIDAQTLLAGVDLFSPLLLHHSTDQGLTWAAIPGSPSIACRDLLAGPSWVLAGGDVGVLRSSDGGSTWVGANAGLPANRDVDRFTVFGGSIFAAVRPPFSFAAVFRSDDDGLSWQQTSTNLPSAALVTALFESGGDLYVGTWVTAGESGLYRSTDGGVVWQEISTTLPVADRILAASVLDGDLVVGTAEGAFRSTDGGASWTDSWLGSAGIFGSEALLWTDDALVAGSQHFGNLGTGIDRTTDFGTTWTPATGIDINTTAVDLIERDGAVFAALYGLERGVSRSTDGGATFAPSDTGIPSNVVMRCLHSHGAAMFAAAWTDLYRSTDVGATWTPIPSMQKVQRLASVGSELFAGRYGVGAAVSTDDGLTWSPINDGLPAGQSTYINDLVSFDGTVYAAINDGGGVRRWNGSSWDSVGLGGTIVNKLFAVDGVLVAGTALEGIWVSTGGGSWSPFVDEYSGGEVYALAATPSRVLAGTRGHGLWSIPRVELPTATGIAQGLDSSTPLRTIVASPNPFRPFTELRYAVSRSGPVRLTIHDVAGRQVRNLVDEPNAVGEHVAHWDGRDEDSRPVAAGVYFARLVQASGSSTETIVRTR